MPTALITGGATGIGRATAKLLPARGYQVAVTGQNPASLARAGSGLPLTTSTSSDLAGACSPAPTHKLGVPESGRDAMRSKVPFERLGAGQEVAEAVAFLASNAAGYITSQDITADGGYGLSV